MDAELKTKIIKWAMENHESLGAYRAVDFEQPDDWSGSCAGPHGGIIHLIAQSETECVYGETLDEDCTDSADYLVADCIILDPGTSNVAVESLLDSVFGDQSEWDDSYAQTHGWGV